MQFQRKRGFYEKYIKRLLDIICAVLAILVFGWLYILIAVLVRVKLGKPVIYKQPRPGMIDPKTGRERIFTLYKFRTMTDERNEFGELLPDEIRLTKFGRILRSTSLDELPEAWCILKGDMSVIGPRPQLVRDMVFMTEEQRMRHVARPGLSGLAQVSGRNAIDWKAKFELDLEYIEHITFLNDLKLVFITIKQVFFKKNRKKYLKEIDVTLDFGDALLESGEVNQTTYDDLQNYAKQLLEESE